MTTNFDTDASTKTQIETLHNMMLDARDQLPEAATDFAETFDKSEWSEVETPGHGNDYMKLKAHVGEATIQWFVKAEVDLRGNLGIPRRGCLLIEGHIDGQEVFVETGPTDVPCPDIDAILRVESESDRL
jgi:hypothetical protein